MSMQQLQSMGFLKSSRFLFQFLKIPDLFNLTDENYVSALPAMFTDNSLESKTFKGLQRDMAILCESIEFPGQNLTTAAVRMPGYFNYKVPLLRERNEITATFLYPIEVPMYEFFNSWITNSSVTSTKTKYYNEITGAASICQYTEESSPDDAFAGAQGAPYMTLNLYDLYPISVNSLQANWSDDAFHRISVTFFFERLSTEYSSRFTPEYRANIIADLVSGFRSKYKSPMQLGRTIGNSQSAPLNSNATEADRYNFGTNITTFKFP